MVDKPQYILMAKHPDHVWKRIGVMWPSRSIKLDPFVQLNALQLEEHNVVLFLADPEAFKDD